MKLLAAVVVIGVTAAAAAAAVAAITIQPSRHDFGEAGVNAFVRKTFRISVPAGADSADLLSNLLGYHRREAKPAWWAYYDRLQASSEELLQNTEAIARLSPVEGRSPRKEIGRASCRERVYLCV